jgi:hypothetical protein
MEPKEMNKNDEEEISLKENEHQYVSSQLRP